VCVCVRFAVDTELVKRKKEKKIDERTKIFLEKKREKIGRRETEGEREREREKKRSRQKG